MQVTPALIAWLKEHDSACPRVAGNADEETKRYTYGRRAAELLLSGDLPSEKYAELVLDEKENDMPKASDVFTSEKATTPSRIRVKTPSEGLSEKRVSAVHYRTNQKMFDAYGQEASLPSEKSLAMSGVYLKHSARKAGLDVSISEWEKSLWNEMIENEQWASFNGEPTENKVFSGSRVKALLDDAISGGLAQVRQ